MLLRLLTPANWVIAHWCGGHWLCPPTKVRTLVLHPKKKTPHCARWLGLLRHRPRLRCAVPACVLRWSPAQVQFGPCGHGPGFRGFSQLGSYGPFLIAMPWGRFFPHRSSFVFRLLTPSNINYSTSIERSSNSQNTILPKNDWLHLSIQELHSMQSSIDWWLTSNFQNVFITRKQQFLSKVPIQKIWKGIQQFYFPKSGWWD